MLLWKVGKRVDWEWQIISLSTQKHWKPHGKSMCPDKIQWNLIYIPDVEREDFVYTGGYMNPESICKILKDKILERRFPCLEWVLNKSKDMADPFTIYNEPLWKNTTINLTFCLWGIRMESEVLEISWVRIENLRRSKKSKERTWQMETLLHIWNS